MKKLLSPVSVLKVFRNVSRLAARRGPEKFMQQLMTIIIRPRKTEISRGYQHQSICFEAFIAEWGRERWGWKKELQIIKAFLSRLFI